jgi:membrane fusion protein (multidrug efflux system)
MPPETNPVRPPTKHRGAIRFALLWVLPALLIAAGSWLYLSGRWYASTDNAYVQLDKAILRAEVAGNVVAVMARENEAVVAGAPLIRIDDSAQRLAVRRAQAELDAARTEVRALQANYAEKAVELDVARRDAGFARRELERQRELAGRKLVSAATLDAAERASEVALGRIAVLEGELGQIRARLSGKVDAAVDEYAEVQAADAAVAQLELDLAHTTITAPRAGIVSHLPQVGDRLDAGDPAAALVATDGAWIEANFKETDLAAVIPGQRVDIEIDSYPGTSFSGRVESIAQATGAEFALLPPQNASGNWVKVVQRVPVRIAIESAAGGKALRAGMSASVRIDLRQTVSAAPALADAAAGVP